MDRYLIQRTSEYAWEQLHRSNSEHGYVHSVYRKTINLVLGGQFLSIQSQDSPLSPISLITNLTEDEMAQLPISPEDILEMHEDSLQIGKSCFFHYRDAERIDTHLNAEYMDLKDSDLTSSDLHTTFPRPEPDSSGVKPQDSVYRKAYSTINYPQTTKGRRFDPASLQRLHKGILAALQHKNHGGFDRLLRGEEINDPFSFLSAAHRRLRTTTSLLQKEQWEEAAGELAHLIGLGIGLTPSGDDFLCGVLAGMQLMHPDPHPFATALKGEILRHLRDTNDISAAFLQCACMDQFSEAVCRLQVLSDGDAIYGAFARIGHSSGMDTLSGIAYILEHLPNTPANAPVPFA